MLFRVMDIETAPDHRFWSSQDKKWRLLPSVREAAAGNYNLRDVELCPEPPFAPPQAQRVVAISWCDVEMDPASQPKTYSFVTCETHAAWSKDLSDPEPERGLLRRFRTVMTDAPASLVTWNGRCFDLPVLAMRALHLGVPWGWYYDSREIRYRYSTDGHCDLMDFLSDYGASRSMKLDDAARLVGLPGKDVPGEEHFDGSMVGELVALGDAPANKDKIARYCLQDVLQTALVFLRTRYHLEIIGEEGYAASVVTFSSEPEVRAILPIDWFKLLLDASQETS